ncbi:uncharacterized protein LOC125866010 [Solanum stenotomum]|uniref:uncharacterized protein LOC125866010 n=1 Tax=Solanum stenotomum TaxID=172797 RepID=UPI0020D1DC79|nr:uncharacterized protein LOC125866010 [Solanum stenotomum]
MKWISARCVLKVDLRKAYDTLEWGFLEKLLSDLGLLAKLVHWIMTCVSTVSYSLADIVSVKLMYDVFIKFSKASGLQANTDKSSIYIAGVSDQTKYLGVPLSSKKLIDAAYLPHIEKITSKITCWSAKLLSYAGRMQLGQVQ